MESSARVGGLCETTGNDGSASRGGSCAQHSVSEARIRYSIYHTSHTSTLTTHRLPITPLHEPLLRCVRLDVLLLPSHLALQTLHLRLKLLSDRPLCVKEKHLWERLARVKLG